MSHTADVVNNHKNNIRGLEEETLEKGLMHILPSEGRRSLWVFGELVTHKVPSHKTGGAYSLFEATTPREAGPPPHVHHREDESFYVLEGEYEFLVDGRTLKAGEGALLYVPKGTLHAHRSVGEGVGRLLLTQTPGGLYELFFEKAGMRPVDGDGGGPPVFGERPDFGGIVEAAAEHGIEIPQPMAKESRSRVNTQGIQ